MIDPHSKNAHLDLGSMAPKAPPASSGSWVMDAGEDEFEQVLARSLQHPLVVEFNSPRANAAQFSADLADLAESAEGRFLLVRVNVDTSPGLAQALGITAVPLVVGVLGGQVMPLFQGTRTREEAGQVIDQLLQAAVANGIVGRAEPTSAQGESEEPVPDPRFADADAALARGDFAGAVEEFDKILAHTPNDQSALEGRAQASLLTRLQKVDAEDVGGRASDPADLEAQLDLADMEVASGRPVEAFSRLVGIVSNTGGDERDMVRQRLLELFEAVGASDPVVLKARRDLMSALF